MTRGDRDIVIVGAPRSGTNMLRDVLTSLPGYATWPCDEINLVWRHGNRSRPSDELTPDLATAGVGRYIRGRFEHIRDRYDAISVVEKTCANSLRVEFVRRVKPDARYVFITRDGLDAAPSAMERWHAPFDVRYTAAKARFVPPNDLPYYGARFVASRIRRRTPHSDAVTSWWGPRTDDAAELMRTRPLDEICMIQWRRCVEGSLRGLSGLPDDQLLHVGYEQFVRDPEAGLRELLDFLGSPELFDPSVVSGVSASSVGKGRAGLSADARERLTELGRPALQELGYAIG